MALPALPSVIPVELVAKICAGLIAALLAYGSLTGEIRVLRSELDHVNLRMERMENKLDQVLVGYGQVQAPAATH